MDTYIGLDVDASSCTPAVVALSEVLGGIPPLPMLITVDLSNPNPVYLQINGAKIGRVRLEAQWAALAVHEPDPFEIARPRA